MSAGTTAIAMVKRQVMVVRVTRPHTKRDKYLDVHTYSPFGERVFLASAVPDARISASDVLTVLLPSPSTSYEYDAHLDTQSQSFAMDMLELSPDAYAGYTKLCAKHQKNYERMWSAMTSH
ncbi:hypothetical protein AMATHDRAFT_3422 [Amanita thiersii Skay4041]|uniref:Uncharacterized protein n=1 Tax=Amanita thiersii Skay4041 TaxID=703135 RepID=A0A2A9NTM4_9AGAR|nr:hypothetical protein AMATHDRAFT_3422 [Amanita thiersii Skay4041]